MPGQLPRKKYEQIGAESWQINHTAKRGPRTRFVSSDPPKWLVVATIQMMTQVLIKHHTLLWLDFGGLGNLSTPRPTKAVLPWEAHVRSHNFSTPQLVKEKEVAYALAVRKLAGSSGLMERVRCSFVEAICRDSSLVSSFDITCKPRKHDNSS